MILLRAVLGGWGFFLSPPISQQLENMECPELRVTGGHFSVVALVHLSASIVITWNRIPNSPATDSTAPIVFPICRRDRLISGLTSGLFA